ncbi:MAG: hypothetical protein K8T10_04060 [Candidatus Eremiobacteraeota bacterium]|nr:hypothetical protein [Candidatus Eremiobacteraeota bacterium]
MLKISAYKTNFKIDPPISISFHTWHYRENVLVFLKYKGLEGVGEASPFKPITGDSQQEVISEVMSLEGIPFDPEKNGLEDLHSFLDEKIKSQTLKAAIDFAYHDLIGKIKGIPVYKIYAEKVCPVDNSITVTIQDSIRKTAEEAAGIFQKYPHLKIMKIKLMGDGMDIDRTRAIRNISPENMRFVLDANQGYDDPDKALAELREMAAILRDVILVEQPCPKENLDMMKFIDENLPDIPIFADESAATVEDVARIIEKRAARGVNIKLQKAGGIYPSKKIARMCRDAGLKIMVGAMLGGPVSASAGAHFACSTPGLVLTDLDWDLDVPPYTDKIADFRNGQRIPPEEVGLGIDIDFDKMNELVKSGDLILEKIR